MSTCPVLGCNYERVKQFKEPFIEQSKACHFLCKGGIDVAMIGIIGAEYCLSAQEISGRSPARNEGASPSRGAAPRSEGELCERGPESRLRTSSHLGTLAGEGDARIACHMETRSSLPSLDDLVYDVASYTSGAFSPLARVPVQGYLANAPIAVSPQVKHAR